VVVVYVAVGVVAVGLLDQMRSIFSPGSSEPPPSRRLDGRSAVLLTASLQMLPYDERGWITIKEAAALFSPASDEYAFGEMDDDGKRNLAAFAAAMNHPARFAFMPAEERLYFIRTQSTAKAPED
jgi:hypothetical protein